MAEIDTSFYKPQPQQNPLDLISKIGGAASSLGDLAVGGATQQALDPATGQIDQNKLLSLLKQSPVGAMKAVPTMDALAKLRQAGYAADQAGLDTFQKRMAITSHLFSGLASKKNPTIDDVYDVAAQALDPALGAKEHGITMPVIMNAVDIFKKLPKGPDGKISGAAIREKALEIQTHAASTAEILEQHSPRGQWIQKGDGYEFVPAGTNANPALGTTVPSNLPPTTPVRNPDGTTSYLGTQPPRQQAVPPPAQVGPMALTPNRFNQRFGQAPTGPAASMQPGYDEAAAGIARQSADSANELTRANDTSMGRKAILGNLEHLVEGFTPGKGADYSLIGKNFAGRNVPMPDSWKKQGGVFDLKSVADQEEFNKQAQTLVQQQFATIGGTGTDAKFSSAYETNPHETMSKLGIQNVLKLLKGNEDAIQAKNKSWQNWKKSHGPQTFAEFSSEFNDHFDPRVFQFKYVPDKERKAYTDGMDDAEYERFLHDMTYARKQGWIKY